MAPVLSLFSVGDVEYFQVDTGKPTCPSSYFAVFCPSWKAYLEPELRLVTGVPSKVP